VVWTHQGQRTDRPDRRAGCWAALRGLLRAWARRRPVNTSWATCSARPVSPWSPARVAGRRWWL